MVYRLPVFTISIIIIMAGSFGCSRASFNPPKASDLAQSQTPVLESAVVVLDEFNADAAKARVIYEGKRLYFKGIIVDVCKPTTRNDPDAYFVSDGVIFKPRYSADLDIVVEGTLLDVVGEVRGYMAGVLVIGDCWLKIVGGATGTLSAGY